MKERSYIHSHIHNNLFQPDAAIFAEVKDSIWKEDYDLEILATRHLGNNLHIIVSIPHFTYGFQRYDLVIVDDKTDIIKSLKHRGRNCSFRVIFNSDSSIDEKKELMDKLTEMGCSLDPAHINLLAADLDMENSRDVVEVEMNRLVEDKKIRDWEYVVRI